MRTSTMRNRNNVTPANVSAVALCLAACFVLCAVAPRGAVDEGKTEAIIREQIAKYTTAIDKADIDLASQIWRTSPDVSFIHPMGHAHGWEEVKGIYRFFGSSLSERKLTARDIAVHVHGDSAWAEFYWHFTAKQVSDGAAVQTDGRETQIYEKTEGRWQLVHVHYSGPAATR